MPQIFFHYVPELCSDVSATGLMPFYANLPLKRLLLI